MFIFFFKVPLPAKFLARAYNIAINGSKNYTADKGKENRLFFGVVMGFILIFIFTLFLTAFGFVITFDFITAK